MDNIKIKMVRGVMHIYNKIKYGRPLVMVATDGELNARFVLKQ